MNAPHHTETHPPPESTPVAPGEEGVDLDFTGVFKVQELRADPPPPPKKPKGIPGDILIGAQELAKGNCYINMSRRRPARKRDPAKTTILIVEDDTTTQYLLHMLLSRSGYQTRRASCAAEFVAAMQKQPLPDLVILDVKLKDDVSGFKILAKIRSHPLINRMPVVILSGHTDASDLMEGVSLGVDAYLSKPTKAQALMDAVKAALGG